MNTSAAKPVEPECTAAEQVDLVASERVAHNAETWLREFKDAGDGTDTPNMPVIRALRQRIWYQTAFLIGNADLSSFTEVVKAPGDLWRPQAAQGPPPEVKVLERDILEEAMRLSKSYSVAVLNMASPRCPGGAVAAGAGAQEETIFRRTNLANFLNPNMYPLSEEDCLVSRGVVVFRGTEQKGYPMLGETCKVTFLSCAAPSRHQAWGGMSLLILWTPPSDSKF